MRDRLNNTYTGYSVGCAVVWAVILLVAQRRLDSQNRNMLRLVCGGWWSGWTSATIARAGYPPPKRLRPEAEKRLGMVSIVLVAGGLISVVRLLITDKRTAASLHGLTANPRNYLRPIHEKISSNPRSG